MALKSTLKKHRSIPRIAYFLFLIVLLTPLISAWDFEYDNYKTFEKSDLEYGKAIIWDEALIGEDKRLMEITLINNSDNCITDCYAEGTMILNEKNKVVDSFRFKNINQNNYENLRYKFYLKEKGTEEWIEYDGKEKKGEYDWRLEAKKGLGETIDWLGTFFGYEIDEWALWGDDIILYYKFEDRNETVSGEFNLTDFEGSPTFQSDGALIGKAGLVTTNNNWNITTNSMFNWTNFNNKTINYWIKPFDTFSGDNMIQIRYTPEDFSFQGSTSGRAAIIRVTGATAFFSNTSALINNTWTMITLARNDTDFTLWTNASNMNISSATPSFDGAITAAFIGAGSNAADEFIGLYDEMGWWNRTLTQSEVTQLYNDGAGLAFGTGDSGLSVSLITPINNTLNISTLSINFTTHYNITSQSFNITNGTYNIWFQNGSLFNQTTVLVTGDTNNATTLEIFNFVLGDYKWNVEACGQNSTSTFCAFASTNSTFRTASLINSFTFNTTTRETATESYIINISSFGGATPTSANLIYDGVSSSATISSSGSNFLITSTARDVPLVSSTVNKTFNFTWVTSGTTETSTNNNQTVFPILFDLCNSTLTTPFINFTFKNETDLQESVNATISSNWQVWLGSGVINQSATISSSTENASYAFCFEPNRTLNSNVILSYNNDKSQQRRFRNTALTLTNITLNQVLYLLPTQLGIFTTFRTEDAIANVIRGVNAVISRSLGGVDINVGSSVTDDSGIVVFFLNPDITYTGTFSLTGFLTNQFTFIPITDTRIVTMGTTGQAVNGSQISLNTIYDITPKNSSLINNTDVTFGFNVTSGQTITLISMNITNRTGGQIGFQSNAGQGFISEVINTGNNSRIQGRYIIQTANETITVSKVWTVGNEFIGDYSIFRQMKLFLDLGFTDFIRLLIVILVIFGTVIFMSAKEITDTSESKLMVVILLLWVFSIVGWLDNPAIVSETGIAQFSKQYGIAILSTFGVAFFVLRRLFIRRI